MTELDPANKERAEAASETVRRYFGREVLHAVNSSGTYDNEDDEIERKNG